MNPYKTLPAGISLLLAMAAASAAPATPPAPDARRPAAEEPALRALHRPDAGLRIDGRLDEAAWRDAPLHEDFVQLEPQDKQPARWRTTVQVIADEQALVFGIRAYDPDAARIRAPLVRRDQVKRDQDFVAVFLDPIGRRQHAQFVRVGANGVVADGSYSAHDDSEDFSTDFDVQAAVQRLPDGYSVELRWPLAQLRYPYVGGAAWRVMVARNVPREDNALWVSVPLTQDSLHLIAELQPLAGIDGLIDAARQRSFLQLRPELTLRRERADGPGSSAADLGLALKWRPRADWVLDATLRPDFSQVELDEPQLGGNTRYALFMQEKRPFFLESRDVTGQALVPPGGSPRGLAGFYSRAITDPVWGLRATWRGADAEATMLSLHDRGGGQVLRPAAFATRQFEQPADSQASFVRAHHQMGQTGLALLASQRDYGEGRWNRMLGSDFSRPLDDATSLRGHLLLSSTSAGFDDRGQLQRHSPEQGHYLWLQGRRRVEAWNHELHLEELSPRFANDNGFVSQSGIRRLHWQLQRRTGALDFAVPGTELRWQPHDFSWDLTLQRTQTLADPARGVPAGEGVATLIQPGFFFTGSRQLELWTHLGLDRQRARSGGRLHAPRTLTLGFAMNPAPWFGYLETELVHGQRLDVDADRLGLGSALNAKAMLRLPLPAGMGLEWDQHLAWSTIAKPDGSTGLREWASQSAVIWHFSAHDSLRAIVQASGLQRAAEGVLPAQGAQQRAQSLLYQHRQGLGRLLSLGCSRSREEPALSRGWECFAKYSQDFWY